MTRLVSVLIWMALGAVLIWPLAVAAASPLLEWRGPIYIGASFAGITALCLMLLQPLLAGGLLPGLTTRRGRTIHPVVGVALVILVVAHVCGLWITSPPDVIDALTFTSPTPFSDWGVVAMWAVFAAAILAAARSRVTPRLWRLGHSGTVALATICTIVHILLIQGTMGTVSKWVLGAAVLAALTHLLVKLRIWRLVVRPCRRA